MNRFLQLIHKGAGESRETRFVLNLSWAFISCWYFVLFVSSVVKMKSSIISKIYLWLSLPEHQRNANEGVLTEEHHCKLLQFSIDSSNPVWSVIKRILIAKENLSYETMQCSPFREFSDYVSLWFYIKGFEYLLHSNKIPSWLFAAHIRPFTLTLQKEKLQEKNFNVFWEFRAMAVKLK